MNRTLPECKLLSWTVEALVQLLEMWKSGTLEQDEAIVSNPVRGYYSPGKCFLPDLKAKEKESLERA